MGEVDYHKGHKVGFLNDIQLFVFFVFFVVFVVSLSHWKTDHQAVFTSIRLLLDDCLFPMTILKIPSL